MGEAERVALRHLASAHKESEKLQTDLEQQASKVLVLQRQVNALDTALQTSQVCLPHCHFLRGGYHLGLQGLSQSFLRARS